MENTENRFKHEGVWYIAVEGDGCRNCAFNIDSPSSCKLDSVVEKLPGCSTVDRKDRRSVIFVESDADNLGDEE